MTAKYACLGHDIGVVKPSVVPSAVLTQTQVLEATDAERAAKFCRWARCAVTVETTQAINPGGIGIGSVSGPSRNNAGVTPIAT